MDKTSLANLHQRFSFVGPAWYQREVEVPVDWAGMDVRLELERVLWLSRLWVNAIANTATPRADSPAARPPAVVHPDRSAALSVMPPGG